MLLKPKQQKAVNLLVQGMSGKDVAKELGVTPQTLSDWKKQDLFVIEMNKMLEQNQEALKCEYQNIQNEALVVASDLLKNGNDDIRAKVALKFIESLDFKGMISIGPTTEREIVRIRIENESNEKLSDEFAGIYN